MVKKLRGKKCLNGLLENLNSNKNKQPVKILFLIIFTELKKITAIFFFTVYLFSTTEAHQLLKLPVFFEHFAEHKEENKQLSFSEFFKIHYLNAPVKDKDYDRDMQLPFKSAADCIASISPAFVPVLMQFAVNDPIEICTVKIFFLNDRFLISAYLSNIWQPPKYC